MGRNVNELIDALPPKQRKEVEKRAAELIAEEQYRKASCAIFERFGEAFSKLKDDE